MILTREKLVSIALMICVSVLVMYLYRQQIQEANEYLGMFPIKSDLNELLLVYLAMVVLFLILPNRTNNPSSIFIGIYIVFVLLWCAFLHGVSGMIGPMEFSYLYGLLLFPVIFIKVSTVAIRKIINNVEVKISLPNILIKLESVFVFYLLVVFILAYQQLDFNMSFDETYVRRLSARDNLGDVLSYLLPIGLNGVAPYLAFTGMLNKRRVYFLFALIFAISGFGLIGTKAPIMFVAVMGGLGVILKNKDVSVLNVFLYAVLLATILATLEYVVFGYSWIADVLIRRAFIVVPQIQGFYMDYFINYASTNELLFGVTNEQDKQITFIIGEKYFNNPATNANTNAFLLEFGRNGSIGYLFSLFFISVFYSFLDVVYKKYKSKEIVGIAILYALIIIEQSYTTALLTSGIALVLFFYLLSLKRRVYKYDYYC